MCPKARGPGHWQASKVVTNFSSGPSWAQLRALPGATKVQPPSQVVVVVVVPVESQPPSQVVIVAPVVSQPPSQVVVVVPVMPQPLSQVELAVL